jgi:hypothetical protein
MGAVLVRAIFVFGGELGSKGDVFGRENALKTATTITVIGEGRFWRGN